MVKSKERSLMVAKAQAYPKVTFRTDLNSFYLRTGRYDSINAFQQIDDKREMSYHLDLAIPIFNKTLVKRGVSNANLELMDAEYGLELEKKQLYKQIQQTHADAVAAYNKYITALDAVSSNEEAFKYTQQKFNVGLVTSVDFNLAKNELLKAKAELVISKFEFIFMTKILDFYSGKPFTL